MPETSTSRPPIAPREIPVLVHWRGRAGDECEETTRLSNFTTRSGTLLLSRPPELGQLLRLTLPTARQSSWQAVRGGQNKGLWALAWAVVPTEMPGEGEARHHVSVVFVGDDVAKGESDEARYAYLAEEDGRFRLQRLAGDPDSCPIGSQRRESRISIPFEVTVEALGADGSVTLCEQTVTENVSRRGAAVWTSLPISPSQLVRLTSQRHGVSIAAIVRGRRTGPDGITRLHLEFIDGQWPLEKMG